MAGTMIGTMAGTMAGITDGITIGTMAGGVDGQEGEGSYPFQWNVKKCLLLIREKL